MSPFTRRALSVIALLDALSAVAANAGDIKTVFVIAMENHNWTQPTGVSGSPQQVYQNPAAPFINSLVNGTAVAVINGQVVKISEHVSYATAYHNVLATPTGNNPSIHPSEPNYLWAEGGTNFGIDNDDDPYFVQLGNFVNDQTTPLHLSNLLTLAGKTWRSYQEDIDLTTDVNSLLTNVVLPQSKWTVPLTSFSGHFDTGSPRNAYNGSNQYNYAAKHNPMVFFTDTNGGNNSSPSNPLSSHYAPLQQLWTDLAENRIADYNWITPDQYNDMHTALNDGFMGLKGDAANIKQGDNFLRQAIPMIMASDAYKNHGVIIIWWDESEGDGVGNENDFNHTIGEIIISDHAHKNVNGVPYAGPLNYTHSSDLRTIQEIFKLGPPFLGDAANAIDLADLFEPGAF